MNKEQFQAEKLYYIALSASKSMLQKGVIDEAVYAVVQANLLEKYHPISAVLLSGNHLT